LTNHIRSALSNLRYNLAAKWKDDRLDREGDDDDSSADDYYEWKYHVDGGTNGRLDEDNEFDDDLIFATDMDGGVRSRISQGGKEVLA
jgi:hypothetical protein